jgi:hypothetical protein
MSLYVRYQSSLSGGGGGGGGGVTSLNTLTGALTLTGGTDVTITPSGTSINISLTLGNLTDAGTDGITVTGGTGAVLGSGTSISQHVADSTHNGYLSSTDWSTFNSKQSSLTLGNLTDVGTDGITVTGGTGAVVGTGTSISQHVADSTHNGYLSSTDWSTFNSKQAALTLGNLTDTGTDGITVTNGTGAVVGTGTSLSQHVADTTHNGYLSSTDWNTFNGKQAAGSYITALTGDVTASGPGSAAASLVATSNSTLTTLSALSLPLSQTTGTLPINRGGTGQTTAPLAFGALSPLTTKGDLLGYDTANNRIPVGADNTVLTADSTSATGVRWVGAVSASYYLTSNNVVPSGADYQLNGFTLNWDTMSIFNTGTNTITAPETGYYILVLQGLETDGVNNIFGYQVNGGGTVYFGANWGNTGFARGAGTAILSLAAGDTVTLFVSPAASCTIQAGATNTYFSIVNFK